MQPADAFLKDLDIMLRTLVAGAVRPSPKPRAGKPPESLPKKAVPKNRPQKSGGRR